MTKRHLLTILYIVGGFYFAAAVGGIVLAFANPGAFSRATAIIPLVIAFPGAYLVAAFQRRISYLAALRALWSHLVDAMAAALVYCELDSPSREEYASTLRQLSAGIEEVSGVFKNIPSDDDPEGCYPFEPLRDIYRKMAALGYGEAATPEKRAETRKAIGEWWKPVRDKLLAEFERDKPAFHVIVRPDRARTALSPAAEIGTAA